jgi:hypothetical protein
LNFYYKRFYRLHPGLSAVENFFLLTDHAAWRISSEISQQYQGGIGVKLRDWYFAPDRFALQLYFLLDQLQIPFEPNTEYVTKAVDNYKRTCYTIKDLDLKNNPAWLAWCHAICLQQGSNIPVDIRQDYEAGADFLAQKSDQFLSLTQQRFLITI